MELIDCVNSLDLSRKEHLTRFAAFAVRMHFLLYDCILSLPPLETVMSSASESLDRLLRLIQLFTQSIF